MELNNLDFLLKAAYDSEGNLDAVNKFYVTLFRTNLYMPVQLNSSFLPLSSTGHNIGEDGTKETEPFAPLYIEHDQHYFVPIFDSIERLQTWAGEHHEKIDHVEITGEAVLRGLSNKAYLCLNIGTPFYKEFSPDEITRLKITIAKMDKLRKKPN